MKKATIVFLFIFWAVVTSVITAGLVFSQGQNSSATLGRTATQAVNTPGLAGATSTLDSTGVGVVVRQESVALTLNEVSRHDTSGDCWLIIDNNIYDISSYFNLHPGGAAVMAPYCGGDGSEAFITKDLANPKDHSAVAREMLGNYFIGALGTSLALADTAASPSPAQTVQASSGTSRAPNALPGAPVESAKKSVVSQTPGPNLPAVPASAPTAQTFSAAMVASHNTNSDCWLIISNNIYDISSYFNLHPGGAAAMAPYCGGDGSAAFASKDKASPQDHSASAYSMLGAYYIGTLGSPVAELAAVAPTPAPVAPAPVVQVPIVAPTPITTPPPPAVVQTTATLNISTIALHNTVNDCWMIISGKVYTLASYFRLHPGGTSVMLPYCGGDGSQAFSNQGHSSFASGLLDAYYIGNVNTTVSVPAPSPAAPGTTNTGQTIAVSNSSGLSPNIANIINEQFPGATIIGAGSEDDGRQEVKLIYNGVKYEVKFDSNGNIREIDDDD